MMSSRPPLARRATDLLAREVLRVAPAGAAQEARAIEAIAGEIQRQARVRRHRRFLAAGVGALAAGFLCALGFTSLREKAVASPGPSAASVTVVGHALAGGAGGVVVLREGREVSLEGGGPLRANDRVIAAADGRASLQISTGTQLALEGGGDVTVVERGLAQVFSLRSGSLRADVAKLRERERFVIRTSDTEVEVRGTSFQVAVVAPVASCGSGTTTRVSVTEGAVVVRTAGGEDRVHGGEHWPRGCSDGTSETSRQRGLHQTVTALPPTSSLPVPVPPSVTSPGPGPAPAYASTPLSAPRPAITKTPPIQEPRPPEALVASSELAAQNQLFAEATAAKRRGNVAAAIAGYDQFLARYPSSSLAETAAVERLRLLVASDRTRAVDAARTYLLRYPNGFAREEARVVVSSGP